MTAAFPLAQIEGRKQDVGRGERRKSQARKRKAEGNMKDLAAIIQSRQASRMGAMIVHMESKYGAQ
jgi:hypothetical protein